jgi:hypothetical protein
VIAYKLVRACVSVIEALSVFVLAMRDPVDAFPILFLGLLEQKLEQTATPTLIPVLGSNIEIRQITNRSEVEEELVEDVVHEADDFIVLGQDQASQTFLTAPDPRPRSISREADVRIVILHHLKPGRVVFVIGLANPDSAHFSLSFTTVVYPGR